MRYLNTVYFSCSQQLKAFVYFSYHDEYRKSILTLFYILIFLEFMIDAMDLILTVVKVIHSTDVRKWSLHPLPFAPHPAMVISKASTVSESWSLFSLLKGHPEVIIQIQTKRSELKAEVFHSPPLPMSSSNVKEKKSSEVQLSFSFSHFPVSKDGCPIWGWVTFYQEIIKTMRYTLVSAQYNWKSLNGSLVSDLIHGQWSIKTRNIYP